MRGRVLDDNPHDVNGSRFLPKNIGRKKDKRSEE
jgi:hypothetical protein